MGQTGQDILRVQNGQLFFIPSGSTTIGVSQSFDSTAQHYVVTMSGASLSQSVLAPIDKTGSYWYIRNADGYVHKIQYLAVSSSTPSSSVSTAIPTSSHLSRYNTPSSSCVTVRLPLGMSGSKILTRTQEALERNNFTTNRMTFSSSHGQYLFINNFYRGTPNADDINLLFISKSSFSYGVRVSGSGLLNFNTTTGIPNTASATSVIKLDDTDKNTLTNKLTNSSSV